MANILRKYLSPFKNSNNSDGKNSEFKTIWMFWLPLFTTWLLMGLENPTTSSLVARLDNAKENLAAFGVAFSAGLLIESPIINLLSAVAAKCRNIQTFILLRKFALSLNFLVFLTHCIVLIPSVFDFLSYDLLGLSQSVSELTYGAMIYLILWPPMVGIRRFYQGVMVADGKTKKIAYGTTLRLLTVALFAVIFVNYKILNGAAAGALTLSLAVCVEAAFIFVVSLPSQRRFLSLKDDSVEELTLKDLWTYYFPLAQTSMLGLAFQPILTFFMARSINPVDSLAAFPVANGFAFMFRTVGLSVTEVYLVFMDKGKPFLDALKKLTMILLIGCLSLYILLAFSPAANFIVVNLLGLSEHLAEVAIRAIMIFTPIIAGTIILSYYRAQVMLWSRTVYLSRGTLLEVVLALFLVWIFVDFLGWGGALSAALGLVIARIAQILFVYGMLKKENKLA